MVLKSYTSPIFALPLPPVGEFVLLFILLWGGLPCWSCCGLENLLEDIIIPVWNSGVSCLCLCVGKSLMAGSLLGGEAQTLQDSLTERLGWKKSLRQAQPPVWQGCMVGASESNKRIQEFGPTFWLYLSRGRGAERGFTCDFYSTGTTSSIWRPADGTSKDATKPCSAGDTWGALTSRTVPDDSSRDYVSLRI